MERDEETGATCRQERAARPGELTMTQVAAIKGNRIGEGSYLEPAERARAWADAMTWTPPTPSLGGAK